MGGDRTAIAEEPNGGRIARTTAGLSAASSTCSKWGAAGRTVRRSMAHTISGLNVGAGGAKTNFVDIEAHTVTITSETGRGTTSGTIALSDGSVLNLTNLSAATWFA